MSKLLEGYRVVDLSTYVAAPTCGRLFADMGAEVIKVEPPSGDVWRYFGTACRCPATEEENPVFDMYNANKKNLCLNLKAPEGREIFFKLLETADVFITNNRVQALKKMGIDYDTLKDRFPRLVYGLLTGYGIDGPDKDDPGFDAVAYWGRSGYLADLRVEGNYPVVPPASFGDASTGTALFGGLCAALLHRDKTGRGDLVDISLYGAAIWYSSTMMVITQPQYNDAYPKKRSQVNPLVTNYLCKDGEWIITCILEYGRFFKPLCESLEIPEMAADPRFNTFEKLLEHRDEAIPMLEAAFAKFDSDTISKRLKAVDCVFGRLRHFREIHKDAQAFANDNVRNFTFKSGHQAVMPMTPLKSREMGKADYAAAPLLGEHSASIVKALGYTDAQVAAFEASGVIKQHADSKK